jgi:hypothetical protein
MKIKFLYILMIPIMAASCKKEVDENNLVGKWDLTKKTIYIYDLKKENLLDSITDDQYGFPVMLELQSNFSCSLYCYNTSEQKHYLLHKGAYNIQSKQLNYTNGSKRFIEILNDKEINVYYDYTANYKKGNTYIKALYSDIEYYHKQ